MGQEIGFQQKEAKGASVEGITTNIKRSNCAACYAVCCSLCLRKPLCSTVKDLDVRCFAHFTGAKREGERAKQRRKSEREGNEETQKKGTQPKKEAKTEEGKDEDSTKTKTKTKMETKTNITRNGKKETRCNAGRSFLAGTLFEIGLNFKTCWVSDSYSKTDPLG